MWQVLRAGWERTGERLWLPTLGSYAASWKQVSVNISVEFESMMPGTDMHKTE